MIFNFLLIQSVIKELAALRTSYNIIPSQKMLDTVYHHADQIMRSYQGHPLFVGDLSAAQDVVWLKNNNVNTVITVASGFHLNYDNSLKHITYDLQDAKTENISAYFDMASFQIDKYLRTGGVLVHCGAGVSRSPTLVIAYLIKYKGMNFLQALKHIKSKRPQACPNLGFQLQLKAYQKNHSAPTKTFLLTTKKKEKQQLPDLVKYNPLHSTYEKSFHPYHNNRASNLNMSKSLKPAQNKEKREIEYLRKMAEFRFGITNMSRWKIDGRQIEIQKKNLNL